MGRDAHHECMSTKPKLSAPRRPRPSKQLLPHLEEVEALTDEEIKQRTGVFSFDVSAIGKRLREGDGWQQVVQGHLFFDHCLSEMLGEALEEPTHLNLDRMSFSAKVDLAAALGLIDGTTKAVLKGVNSLRNSIVHKLDFKVSDGEVAKLEKLASKRYRELIDEESEKAKSRLYGVLIVNLVLLDISRQHWAARRMFDARASVKLQKAMENAKRVLEETAPFMKRNGPPAATPTTRRPARKS
jgi:hypothetical protein